MLILHGTWLIGRGFLLWAEKDEIPAKGSPRSEEETPSHPYAVQAGELGEVLRHVALTESGAASELSELAFLPSIRNVPLPSPELIRTGVKAPQAKRPRLQSWRIPGLLMPPLQAFDLLLSLPAVGPLTRSVFLGSDIRFWGQAARWVAEMLAGQRFVPILEEEEGRFRARWVPVIQPPRDTGNLRTLVGAMPPVCRAFTPNPEEAPSPDVVLRDFVEQVVDKAVREWGREAAPQIPSRKRSAASLWLRALFAPDGNIEADERQRKSLSRLARKLQEWQEVLWTGQEASFRICFRLDPPEDGDKTWHIRFFLQAHDDPSLLVPAEMVWTARGRTLQYLHYRFEQPQERLLAGLGIASRVFPPLERSLRSARPVACPISIEEAYTFLRGAAPVLQASGFGVLMPAIQTQVGVKVHIYSKGDKSSLRPLGFNEIVRFQWEVALGDHTLTREEFERLVALKVPLVQVRGQWVELRPEMVEKVLRFWEEHGSEGDITLGEAMHLLAGDGKVGELPVIGVEVKGWVREMLERLQAGDRLVRLPPPRNFNGELRPYQVHGFSWLAFLSRWGLGACLADDMGLGKTIQVIALLLHERENGQTTGPTLVVCPTSVIWNWQREIARFGPPLRTMVHHGPRRLKGEEFAEAARQHDVVITSYSLLYRDVEDFASVEWHRVVLDEAQKVKNPSTKSAQAARRLKALHRVALTGTPVENRLSELWSIFQFLNPGYLGSFKSFRRSFAIPIERYGDEDAAKRLKTLVGPFILRRVKTDPRVIKDLPEKIEVKVYAHLTEEQATLYQAVVEEGLTRVEEAEGIRRKGQVLAMLLKLKQICNHPALFLKDGSPIPGRSGKLSRLTEMLEEVIASDDRALIFTQFAQMGKMLQEYLRATLGVEVLFLHGGTPVKERERMIARFQSDYGPPVFILSIKAGGLGLNLTRAACVFHFDRWWNPAVEDQATDRAFRIGQTRNVYVYKFICRGTVEEKIDELIEAKRELAKSILGTGEEWLTELSTDELREMLRLREEALGE